MQIKEFYEAVGGDYEDAKIRLVNDDMLTRFVIMFLEDSSFKCLSEELPKKNYGEAFRAVHTIKGLSRNLGFDQLGDSAANLTETLRKWQSIPVDEDASREQFRQLETEYRKVVNEIVKLKASDD